MISLNILIKVTLLSFTVLIGKSDASCFGRDAHFKKTDVRDVKSYVVLMHIFSNPWWLWSLRLTPLV